MTSLFEMISMRKTNWMIGDAYHNDQKPSSYELGFEQIQGEKSRQQGILEPRLPD